MRQNRLWHVLLVAFFFILVQMGIVGCSLSQQQGEEDELESDYQEEVQGEENAEQGEEDNEEVANEEPGSNNEMAEEESQMNDSENVNSEAYNEGYNEESVEGEQLAQNEGINSGEQAEDLQEIIDEMNQGVETESAQANVADAGSEGEMAEEEAMSQEPVVNAVSQEAVAETPLPPVDGGQVEAMPAPISTNVPSVLPELGSKMSYIVQRGDSLATIAQKVYGDMAKWREIANFTGVSNPRLIYPGDVVYYQLTEQTTAFAQAYESVTRSEIQVQPGDTLATISQRVLGDSQNWKLIWRQNDTIDNPDKLIVGTTLYYVDPSAVMANLKQPKAQTTKIAEVKIVNKMIADNTVKTSQIVNGIELLNSVSDEIENDFLGVQIDNNGITRVI